MDSIVIENISVRAIVGVHPWEREIPQEVRVSLRLAVDLRQAAESDELASTLDYEALSSRIGGHVRTAARQTIEALAADIAQLCLEDPRVKNVEVRVDKPGALAEAQTVAVVLERTRVEADRKAREATE